MSGETKLIQIGQHGVCSGMNNLTPNSQMDDSNFSDESDELEQDPVVTLAAAKDEADTKIVLNIFGTGEPSAGVTSPDIADETPQKSDLPNHNGIISLDKVIM